MKRWIVILIVLLLTGCSPDQLSSDLSYDEAEQLVSEHPLLSTTALAKYSFEATANEGSPGNSDLEGELTVQTSDYPENGYLPAFSVFEGSLLTEDKSLEASGLIINENMYVFLADEEAERYLKGRGVIAQDGRVAGSFLMLERRWIQGTWQAEPLTDIPNPEPTEPDAPEPEGPEPEGPEPEGPEPEVPNPEVPNPEVPAPEAPAPEAPAPEAAGNYDENLEMIKSASVRNTNHDDSPYLNTAMADIPTEALLGPRAEYLEVPGGNPEQSFPTENVGSFRTSCEFSHFAYDDPLVFPNQPGASHLHMFWGNTDANAYSTYDTLLNSGGSTCNGQELNRTGYWAPAMFDAEGNVRIPERIIVYYKGYGLANGASEVYPPGAAVIANENLHEVSVGGVADFAGDVAFICTDQFRGFPKTPQGNTIPACGDTRREGVRRVLEMHVKFPNCVDGDAADPESWKKARQGQWFYSDCQDWTTFPNMEYIIAYPLENGETTEGWYLSSDVNMMSGELGTTPGESVHADWWGAWKPEVNEQWIDNCVNLQTDAKSGCGFGYLTDGGPDGNNPLPGPALKYRPQYEGVLKVPATTLYSELCSVDSTLSSPSEAAFCQPGDMEGMHHGGMHH